MSKDRSNFTESAKGTSSITTFPFILIKSLLVGLFLMKRELLIKKPEDSYHAQLEKMKFIFGNGSKDQKTNHFLEEDTEEVEVEEVIRVAKGL